MTMIIVRAKIAFAETARGCGAAIEETFVDGDGSRFVGAAGCERMDHPDTRTEGDRGLTEPPLERGASRFIGRYSRRERFGSKWKIITNPHRAADIFDVAAERFRGDIQRIIDQEPAWVHIWTLAKIKGVGKANGVYEVLCRPEEEIRLDLGVRDLYTAH